MSRRDVDAALAAANPVDRAGLDRLQLGGEPELLDAIVASGRPERAASPVARRSRPLAARIAPFGLAAAGAGAAAFAIALGSGGGSAPESAFGAELARISKDSPIVVVDRAERSEHPQRAPRDANARTPIWDCTHLPCRKRAYGDAVKAGIVQAGIDVAHLPDGVRIVVAPRDRK